LSDFDILWTTKERKDSSTEETINVQNVHKLLKCHRNASKQTNPLQVDDLITNKSLAIFEASRRIMDTHSVKMPLHANIKHFYKHHDTALPYSNTRPM
jgi:hypothetical protein